MPLGRVKTEKKERSRLSVYLDDEIMEFLDDNSTSKSDLVRQAMYKFMNDWKDGEE